MAIYRVELPVILPVPNVSIGAWVWVGEDCELIGEPGVAGTDVEEPDIELLMVEDPFVVEDALMDSSEVCEGDAVDVSRSNISAIGLFDL